MHLPRLTVRIRLLFGFGALVLALTLVGSVGVFGLLDLKQQTRHVVSTLFPNTYLSNGMIHDLNTGARALRNTLVVSDPQAVQRELGRMAAARRSIAEKVEQLEFASRSPEERALLDQVGKARATYESAEDGFVAALKAGQPEAARAIFLAEIRGAKQADYIAAVEALVESQSEAMARVGAGVEATVASMIVQILVVGGIGIVAGMAIGYVVTRRLMRQLGGEPDYAVEVARRITDGDLVQPVTTVAGDRSSVLAAMRAMQETLARVVGHIREATDHVAIGSREIAQGNADLSQRTEEQASSLEETASSMEELTSTVKQNADNARQANQLAASASEVAAKGGAVVGEVVSTMDAISASSKKIADIISVIDGIAFQTNILALNAAVEAARAGEQGRGFAVVASEVRNLAQRSAGAAKEIKELITDSVGKVDSGTKLVADAGNTMAEVVASVKRVTDIMAEITAASLEQSSGIEQVNQAIVQMDQVTQQNAALVEESAAAAESMEEQAKQLSSVVAVFKVAGGNVATPAKAVIERAQATAKAAVSPARRAKAPSKVASKPVSKLTAKSGSDDEWAEF